MCGGRAHCAGGHAIYGVCSAVASEMSQRKHALRAQTHDESKSSAPGKLRRKSSSAEYIPAPACQKRSKQFAARQTACCAHRLHAAFLRAKIKRGLPDEIPTGPRDRFLRSRHSFSIQSARNFPARANVFSTGSGHGGRKKSRRAMRGKKIFCIAIWPLGESSITSCPEEP
jgi:hypothetical protein